MRPALLLLLVLCGLAAPAYGALQITSVSPSVAAPGATLTVTGGPFHPEVQVLLGEEAIRPSAVEARRLQFTVPALAPGQYLLRLAEQGLVSTQAFTLQVTEPVPRISDLEPRTIEACQSGSWPQITVSGSGFLPGAALLLDGAAVPTDNVSASRIVFTAPNLPGGQHEVRVVNPAGARSLPRSLEVNGQPVIDSVDPGSSNVTSYEVTISGQNFLGASRLIVDGRQVPMTGTAFPQQDSARYVDCNTIIYTRHPYSTQPKATAIQVINPGGQQSRVYSVEIP